MRALSRTCSKISLSIDGQSSQTKLRFKPGAILFPINAASIKIVPEPQNGSTNKRSGFQRDNKINEAANVSFNGASPANSRYPRLCNPGPVVSIVNVTTSFNKATSIL